MLGQDEILIKAKFDSSCMNCSGEVFAGDSVFWVKGVGVRHQTCTQIEEKSELVVIGEDTNEWKDHTPKTIKEASNLMNCQRCGAEVSAQGDKLYLGAYNAGVYRVCKSCFDK